MSHNSKRGDIIWHPRFGKVQMLEDWLITYTWSGAIVGETCLCLVLSGQLANRRVVIMKDKPDETPKP